MSGQEQGLQGPSLWLKVRDDEKRPTKLTRMAHNPSSLGIVRLRFLVVDDSKTVVKQLAHSLRLLHCDVETATNGREALDKMSCGSFDGVFMDFEMPVSAPQLARVL